MNDKQMRERVNEAPVVEVPPPWRRVQMPELEGVQELGFSVGAREWSSLLVVLADSAFVLSCESGSVVESVAGEDYFRYVDGFDGDLVVPGFASLADERYVVEGIRGGGLLRTTADGWIAEVVSPSWPLQCVLLHSPGATDDYGGLGGEDSSSFKLVDRMSDYRACGFDSRGRSFVLARSLQVSLWDRN